MNENLHIGSLGVASEMTREPGGATELDFLWLLRD